MQTNVLEFFLAGALERCPEKTAIIDGDVRISFAELDRRSKNLAAAILARAEVLNEPVAVYLPKSADVVIANIAIMYVGGIYMNLDTKIPPLRLKNILDHIGPKLVITSRAHAADIPGAAAGMTPDQILCVDDIAAHDLWEEADGASFPFRQLIDTDPVCIINWIFTYSHWAAFRESACQAKAKNGMLPINRQATAFHVLPCRANRKAIMKNQSVPVMAPVNKRG